MGINIQILGIKACEMIVGLFYIKILYILCISPRNLDNFCRNDKQTDRNLILLNHKAYKEKYALFP